MPARSRKKPAAKLTNKNEKAGHTWEPAGVAKAAARWGERTQNRERREVGRPQGREHARELPDTTYRLVQTGFDDGDLGVVRDKKTRHAANRCKGARDQHLKDKTLLDRWPIGWPSEVVFFSNYGGPVLRDVVKTATGRSDYATFTHQLLQGPIDLMRTGYAPIRHQLMREIRHQIARDAKTQIRPF